MKKGKLYNRYIKLADLLRFPIRLDHYDKEHGNEHFVYGIESVLEYAQYLPRYRGTHLMCEWISVDDRLPTPCEYVTPHDDGPDTLKRLLVAYKTDTIEYAIGCYDGYKWVNQLGNKKIKNVIAWKPFEVYKPGKGD